MRSLSVRPARLILVPSAPPVTRPCAFPSHIILVNPSSHMPFYLFISFNISSHLCVFSPPCPRPLGKVPGFSAKTVHFPPWPTGALAPQASLAALGISTPGESAGFFGENGSLSPVANKGTGSTGLSRGTCRFYPWGKCLVYRYSEKEHLLDLG